MKRILLILLLLILIGGAVAAWIFVGPATGFSEDRKPLYIRTTAAHKKSVIDSLRKNDIVKNFFAFEWIANRLNYWSNIKPGKYDIEKGMSLLSIVRKLRNGQQTPVNFTIIKIRTKEDLAKLVGRKFETDSATMIAYLNNSELLKKEEINSLEAIAMVLPDTYTYFWNASPETIYGKMVDASMKFWNKERKQKAESLGLTPMQAYTLASIVEEETNASKEKGTIASVYLNRIKKGMPLQADPTVKFALQDFGLKRIYEKHLMVESPYNTYRNKGLPPGPICTPSKATIDAVLNAPQTDYFYFVASKEFNGTHVFAKDYNEHLKYAKEYQQELNKIDSARKAKASNL